MQNQNMDALFKQAAMLKKMFINTCFQDVEAYDFTPCEIDILLSISSHQEVNTNKELVAFIGVSKGLIARSVESLIQRQLVCVKEDGYDKRIQHLVLTETSNALITKLKQSQERYASKILAGISEEEQTIVKEVFQKIRWNLEHIEKGE